MRFRDRYGAGNVEAARIILGDVDRYGGTDSALVRWARRAAADAPRPARQAEMFEIECWCCAQAVELLAAGAPICPRCGADLEICWRGES